MNEPNLPDGIDYGGEGPGGEYYTKEVDDLSSISIWTKGEEHWTAEELRAIADHQDWLKRKKHCGKSDVLTAEKTN